MPFSKLAPTPFTLSALNPPTPVAFSSTANKAQSVDLKLWPLAENKEEVVEKSNPNSNRFLTSCFLLNAIRLENQTGFVAWLITMTFFVIWKIVQLSYTTIVNDMIFGYNLFTFFSWMIFNILNIGSLVVVYSFYQELRSLDHLETITQQKLDISSRAGSVYGSRAGSVYGSRAGSIYGTPLDTINRQYFGTDQSGPPGVYAATPAYVGGDSKSLYTSTPREHIYDSLKRPQAEQIYSTVIH